MPYPLTTQEIIQVDLASKGETTVRREWPREALEKFLATDVITARGNRKRKAKGRPSRSFLIGISSVLAVCIAVIYFSRSSKDDLPL